MFLVAIYQQLSQKVVVKTFLSQILQWRFPPGSLITTRIKIDFSFSSKQGLSDINDQSFDIILLFISMFSTPGVMLPPKVEYFVII